MQALWCNWLFNSSMRPQRQPPFLLHYICCNAAAAPPHRYLDVDDAVEKSLRFCHVLDHFLKPASGDAAAADEHSGLPTWGDDACTRVLSSCMHLHGHVAVAKNASCICRHFQWLLHCCSFVVANPRGQQDAPALTAPPCHLGRE